ncbi:fibronectin type III domain-containing protein, partial [Psychroflexus maritimus]
MKKITMLVMLFLSLLTYGQTLTETYTAGDISTGDDAYDENCSELLSITLPSDNDWLITSVDVSYDMTAQNGGWMSEQRSQLHLVNSNSTEDDVFSGSGTSTGTFNYDRTGVTFANGIFAAGTQLDFELRAWRTYSSSGEDGCTDYNQKVDNDSWTITVTYEEAPDCQFASGITLDEITDTTADLSWNASPSETEGYTYVVMNQGDAPDEATAVVTGTTAVGETTVNLVGLEGQTNYSFYIKTNCANDEESDWTPVFSFETECGAVGDFDTDFGDEDAGLLPNCWSGITNSTGNFPSLEVTTFSSPTYGDQQVRFQSSGDVDTEHYLISPVLNNLTDGDKRVRFSARQVTASHANVMEVGTMSDPEDENTFTSIQTINFEGNETEDYFTILEGIDTNDEHFVFKVTFSNTFSTVALDRVFYEDAPDCVEPTNFEASFVGNDSVDLEWLGSSTALVYEVVYSDIEGFDPDSEGTSVFVEDGTSTTISDLFENTTYEFYVRSVCDEDGNSAWSNLLTETTLFPGAACATPLEVTALPYSDSDNVENFGNFLSSEDRPDLDGAQVSNGSGSASYLNGPDVVYAFTPTEDGVYNFDLTTDVDDWTSLWLFEGCPFTSVVGYHVTTSGLTRSLPEVALEQNVTYYVVASGWTVGTGPESYNYTLDITQEECPSPYFIELTDTTTTTADIEWGEISTADNYNWVVVALGDDVEDENNHVASGSETTNSVNLSGLDQGTRYEFYISTECGETETDFAEAFEFATECALIGDFETDFGNEETGLVPICWNGITNSTGSLPYLEVTTFSSPTIGEKQVRFASSGDEDTEHFLVSPELNNLVDGEKRLRFNARQLTATHANTMEVGVMSDPNDETSFVSIETINFEENSMEEFEVELLGLTTEAHFAFRVTFSQTFSTVLLDQVIYEDIPTCLRPSDIELLATTTDGADFSWNEIDNAEAYNWIIVEAGTDAELEENHVVTGTSATSTANVTGLNAGTFYDFYVVTDCGETDGESMLSNPVNFNTECDTFGNFENDFGSETLDELPLCWSGITNSAGTPQFNVSTSGSPEFGGQQMLIQSSNDADTEHFLVSPELNNFTDVDKRLRFNARQLSSFGSNVIEVGTMTDPTDEATFTSLESITLSDNDAEEFEYIFEEGIEDDYFAFKFTFSGTFQVVYIDQVIYDDAPECLSVEDLVVDGLSETTADFSWEGNDTATDYNWFVFEEDADVEEDDALFEGTTAETNATVEGLTGETSYILVVQTACDQELSELEQVEFFTGYCTPSSSNTSDYIEEFSTSGAVTNVSVVKDEISPDGYQDLSETDIVTSFPGGEFDISNTFNYTSNNVGIWIDFNNNLQFEEDELVFFESASSNTKTGTISIPSEIEEGSYRMRLRARFGTFTDVTPCGSQTFADAIDFTLEVQSAPDCPQPSELTLGEVGASTVGFSWAGSEANLDYTWYVYEAGADPETATAVDTGTTSETNAISNDFLTEDVSSYDIYVEANCADDEVSSLTGPINFEVAACEVEEQCVYTFELEDDFGDGWNGNSMDVLLDGEVVATIGLDFTSGSSFTEEVTLCQDQEFELYWNAGGGFPTEVGVEIIDPDGDSIYSKAPGVGSQDSSLFTGTACPSDPVFANVQIIHNSPDAAASSVDVYLNGDLLPDLTGVDFRTASEFLLAPATEEITVDVVPAGQDIADSVHTENFTLAEDESYIIVANGFVNDDFELSVYAGAQETSAEAEETAVLVHHGSPDAPVVNVANQATGDDLVTGIAFTEFQGYLDLPESDYILDITDTNGDVVASYEAPLATLALGGNAITVVASGLLAADAEDVDAFGLWVALPTGGDLVPLPLVEVLPAPMEPAPTPTEEEENVISLFSNAYTDEPVDTFLTVWSAAELEDIQIQGVDTKLYTNLDFAGIETVANPIDATQMDFFHLDVWSPNATTFRIKLVDLGDGVVEGEIAYEIPQEEWVSLEIDLADFADADLVTNPDNLLTVRNSIQQIIISGLPVGAVTAYVDNIYFSQEPVSTIDFDSSNFSYYPVPVKANLNIQSTSTVEQVEVFNTLGQRVISVQPKTEMPVVNMQSLQTGVYLMKVQINGNQETFQI